MSLEKAKEIALIRNPRFNRCHVYEDGYHFFTNTKEETDGDSGAVVLKRTGQVVGWIQFILQYHPNKEPLERIEF